ncbi:MAG: hypothetical protein H6695_07560 [Deferribacteres bacterium]|nr:hypothetical protein [candidate division KSB1 bacterium]MCB9510021.1 hypothetical protein [Deferribacteres bacterium]
MATTQKRKRNVRQPEFDEYVKQKIYFTAYNQALELCGDRSVAVRVALRVLHKVENNLHAFTGDLKQFANAL